jgi:transposase
MARMASGSKQRRQRRSFTDEFKAGAVSLVLDRGRTISQVARDLDVAQSVVGGWVKQARADRSDGKAGLTTAERAELTRLRRELKTLTMERDLLKKAAVSSIGQGNIFWKTSAGDRKPSVFLGRWFRRRATALSRCWVKQPRGVFLGKYCRRRRLVFSLVPRCQGL